jgi:hypothetical protein
VPPPGPSPGQPAPPSLAGTPLLIVPVRVDLWDIEWFGEAPVPVEGRPAAPSLWTPRPVVWPLPPLVERD